MVSFGPLLCHLPPQSSSVAKILIPGSRSTKNFCHMSLSRNYYNFQLRKNDQIYGFEWTHIFELGLNFIEIIGKSVCQLKSIIFPPSGNRQGQ
jgi:hypothetical protein